MLEIEISATGAVNVVREGKRNAPGVKSLVARLASPRPQPNKRSEKISDAFTTRTETVATTASRADHLSELSPATVGKHIQNQLPQQ
jgi:hypothetical protein